MKEKNEVPEAKGIAQDAVGASLEVGTSMLLDNLRTSLEMNLLVWVSKH